MTLRDQICSSLCRYHKPDRPEQGGCGGVLLLVSQDGADRFRTILRGLRPDEEGPLSGLHADCAPLRAVCERCEYLPDGCDFRDPSVSSDQCAPCGGLRAVAALLANGFHLGL